MWTKGGEQAFTKVFLWKEQTEWHTVKYLKKKTQDVLEG